MSKSSKRSFFFRFLYQTPIGNSRLPLNFRTYLPTQASWFHAPVIHTDTYTHTHTHTPEKFLLNFEGKIVVAAGLLVAKLELFQKRCEFTVICAQNLPTTVPGHVQKRSSQLPLPYSQLRHFRVNWRRICYADRQRDSTLSAHAYQCGQPHVAVTCFILKRFWVRTSVANSASAWRLLRCVPI